MAPLPHFAARPQIPGVPRPLPAAQREVLRALTCAAVPEADALDAAGWDAVLGTVATALAARPAALRRQLSLLLRALEWLPVLRYGRRLSRLDAARRARVLARLERAPLLALRRGFWGARTLVLMGYYTRPGADAEVGYRADPRGWEARA